ncbi:hypothetical protein BDQ12DRAFT_710665 [Crucibulum laeve]|uniref:Adenine DNA glycosylase n=1 Tax=Crucibulum laeve TaxID=68775 RepID=A0A5C3MCP5_9AGAR|nr:hypothetical protein BDQ12DRAFT_710665 [Crucibulum laeve]
MAKRRRVASAADDAWSEAEASASEYHSSGGSDLSFSAKPKKKHARKKPKHISDGHSAMVHQEKLPMTDLVQHPRSIHTINSGHSIRTALLQWYSTVHETRGMPWRKPYDASQGPEERAQRAYEVWVSEIMLQQTQVATVIPYYNRWMEKFPTIRDLASSTIDQVNSLWKGLGYYSRASRLLSGAQKAVQEYNGKLPDNAKEMEENIPGIGRYSAGAICSIAYGERVPVLDGNVNRLLSRFLALHAPPKSKTTLNILWAAAAKIVQIEESDVANGDDSPQYAGDINQALIELGSTVCKVRDPICGSCPLQSQCGAYQRMVATDREASIPDIEDVCQLCEPTHDGRDVTSYPMKVEKKKAREELDIVTIIEWHSKIKLNDQQFLLVKRPETGLLAGLYEFPTLENIRSPCVFPSLDHIPYNVSSVSNPTLNAEGDVRMVQISPIGDIIHIFSHIKKTYRVQKLILEGGEKPPQLELKSISSTTKKTMPPKSKKVPRRKSKTVEAQDVAPIWLPLNGVSDAKFGESGDANSVTVRAARHAALAHILELDDINLDRVLLWTVARVSCSVLNLPKTASQEEIHERYRSLSLLFHPDKQQDPERSEIALKTFLNVQKAYEVLSDPFLRQVYDVLGEKGLLVKWPEELRNKSWEEIRVILEDQSERLQFQKMKRILAPKTSLSCAIYATPFLRRFITIEEPEADGVQNITVLSCTLNHNIEKRIDNKTTVSLGGEFKHSGWPTLSGTIRHQFSPRFASLISVNAFRPHLTKLHAQYADGINKVSVSSAFVPMMIHRSPPPLNISLARKLFPHSSTLGRCTLQLGRSPSFAFALDSGSQLSLDTNEASEDSMHSHRILSVSGLAMGSIGRSLTIQLSAFPKIIAATHLTLTELAIKFTLLVDYSLKGLGLAVSAAWSNDSWTTNFLVSVQSSGVSLVLDASYLSQGITLPIILSTEYNATVAFFSTILPPTVGLIGYHFLIQPRRRAQRLEQIRAARKALRDDSDARRERATVEEILKDIARKHTQNEIANDGLVIKEAAYGPVTEERGDGMEELFIDVTIPIQALVRKSRLYIPGGTKAGLQGFSDPSPFTDNVLRVHYLFHGRKHFAEIPDHIPVVLPLTEHCIDENP